VRGIQKRLKTLETHWRMQRASICHQGADIKTVALGRLSATDRDLFHQRRTEGADDTQEYKDMMVRFEAAFAAASLEFGVPYFDASDRGWL
jgi:hypothetical protein